MIEKRRYRFRVLSPLHIGSGEIFLPAIDFVSLEKQIFVLDQVSLFKEMSARGISFSFIREFSNRGRKFELGVFLKRYGLFHVDFLKRVSRYRLEVSGSPREIHAFIKSMGRPYIPGSSVKGAIRVGMLYQILKGLGQDFLRRELWEPLERKIDGLKTLSGDKRKRERKRLRQRIGYFIDRFLWAFRLKEDKDNPHTDLLRCLKVSDSPPLDLASLSVTSVQVKKLNGQGSVATWVEVLKPGTTFTLTVEIDRELLNLFKKDNPSIKFSSGKTGISFKFDELYERLFEEPLSPAVQMVNDLLQEERQRLPEKWFQFGERQPNFRFGWGQGLLSTTVFLLLPSNLRKKLRNELFKDEGNAEAPLTRKISTEGLFGFCHVVRLQPKKME